jgi:hypothetical protein
LLRHVDNYIHTVMSSLILVLLEEPIPLTVSRSSQYLWLRFVLRFMRVAMFAHGLVYLVWKGFQKNVGVKVLTL